MNQSEKMQQLFKRYEEEHDHLATSTKEVASWAVKAGLLLLPKVDPLDVLADRMSRALREEYAIDEHGRRYRVNYAVRITKNGAQTTIWGKLGFASREHAEIWFQQRREQIINDCCQLKTDVDVYNDKHSEKEPFQLVLDFTEDVAEREFVIV